MTGAGNHVTGGEAGFSRADPHTFDQLRREFDSRCVPVPRFVVSKLQRRENLGQGGAKRLLHPMQHRVVWMAEIHCEEDLARNDIAAVRPVFDQADGADRIGRMIARDGVDPVDHARRAEESVLAKPHRGRASVRLLSGDRDLVPAHALHALYDADHAGFIFQDRALLDVQFEHCAELMRAGFLAPRIADAA